MTFIERLYLFAHIYHNGKSEIEDYIEDYNLYLLTRWLEGTLNYQEMYDRIRIERVGI